MIELKNISKSYKMGSFEQRALDDVSISFRDNEFVAVLGPSGSGKTTLLNILGGLDRSDSGDIVINGTSTKRYKSSDWDTYRNHRIGFIFQSYNLIPHQTILSNVELALTLSGVSRVERRARAAEALEKVGLGDHINKKPNQLSGGQMQRVAIARALVNDPDIVLADEPTGALDTTTGTQVMDLLSEIANDRLVIMVTHNPELAESYATRIVRLSDGQISDDSNPLVSDGVSENSVLAAALIAGEPVVSDAATASFEGATQRKRERKASMSFLTALSLSFNNLMTKKGRTFLTAFAGSIGIIGIAAILALSNGVNEYIAKVEEDTLSSYPLTISKSSYDVTSLITGTSTATTVKSDTSTGDISTTVIPEKTVLSDMFAKIKSNDLSSFKTYLDSGQSGIEQYVNTIRYGYGITPQIYGSDTSDGVVQLNPSSFSKMTSTSMSSSSAFDSLFSSSSFEEMIDDQDLLDSQYDVVTGRWPESYDECVLVLGKSGTLSDFTLYNLGVLDPEELESLMKKVMKSEKVDIPDTVASFTYNDAMNLTFKVVPSCDDYKLNAEYGTWTDMSDDEEYMLQQVNNGTTLKVVGVVRPNSTTSTVALSQGIAYTHGLITHLMSQAAASPIVQQQKANPEIDVFTGKTFDELQSGQVGSLDFGSMISVDQDAIRNAFSFDTSALDTSSSNVDTSSLMDVPAMTTMLSNIPSPDFSSLNNTSLTTDQLAAVNKIESNLVSGFITYWFSRHPGETISATTNINPDLETYLVTDGVQKQINQIVFITGQASASQVQNILRSYMANTFMPYLQNMMAQTVQQMADVMVTSMQQSMNSLVSSMGNAISLDTSVFASAIHFNMDQGDLTSLLTNYMNASELTYDNNISKLGYAEEGNPESISIYPKDFADKGHVLTVIDAYNQQMQDEGKTDQVISYTDIMGSLISSVTDIVNMISLVLIAFVSISLVVSSIMIGIITYISVLERKKEIGILRAMGASKRNIGNVFNAETIIEGLIAGVFAIVVVLAASIPVNMIVLNLFQVSNIMTLPWTSAVALIGISVVLTLVAGLIPSSAASRRDPVEALRSE